ncbi:hypothetical protein BAUCODRAFT_36272 [Baudoinia panamericana UAMH 10762]|uniref:Uncharacterized protein n=1 Tax=Baudoinia panamericana (strain UAMH 10762) TaxID=717646 RepID=M2LI08_BAUPA|nr:uncharacterized protein BAUCODRAFT_36272 [Baudoinia panamericana UAMH 10762]EMC93817.1 hypothetical protein BAUCODRAFT_36272 [Baudoinia panamericana UAMH 10762]
MRQADDAHDAVNYLSLYDQERRAKVQAEKEWHERCTSLQDALDSSEEAAKKLKEKCKTLEEDLKHKQKEVEHAEVEQCAGNEAVQGLNKVMRERDEASAKAAALEKQLEVAYSSQLDAHQKLDEVTLERDTAHQQQAILVNNFNEQQQIAKNWEDMAQFGTDAQQQLNDAMTALRQEFGEIAGALDVYPYLEAFREKQQAGGLKREDSYSSLFEEPVLAKPRKRPQSQRQVSLGDELSSKMEMDVGEGEEGLATVKQDDHSNADDMDITITQDWSPEMKALIEKYDAELKAARYEIKCWEEKQAENQKCFDQQEEEKKELEGEKDALKEQKEKIEIESQALKAQKAKLEADFTAVQEEKDDFATRLAQVDLFRVDADLKRLQEAKDSSEAELKAQLNEEKQKSEAEVKRLKSIITNKEQTMKQREQTLQNSMNMRAKVEKELAQLKDAAARQPTPIAPPQITPIITTAAPAPASAIGKRTASAATQTDLPPPPKKIEELDIMPPVTIAAFAPTPAIGKRAASAATQTDLPAIPEPKAPLQTTPSVAIAPFAPTRAWRKRVANAATQTEALAIPATRPVYTDTGTATEPLPPATSAGGKALPTSMQLLFAVLLFVMVGMLLNLSSLQGRMVEANDPTIMYQFWTPDRTYSSSVLSQLVGGPFVGDTGFF